MVRKMTISLSFKRMFLEPGKTFAVPTVAGDRVRVADGLVWATTSSNPDDLWLATGDDYTVRHPGLTVIESVSRSTVELVPLKAIGLADRVRRRYDAAMPIPIPQAIFKVAAVAMTAITLGLLVVLPAKVASGSRDATAAAAIVAAPASIVVRGSRGSVMPPEPATVQASGAGSPAAYVQ